MSKPENIFQEDCRKFYTIELKTPDPPLIDKIKMWVRHFGLHCVAVYRLGEKSKTICDRHKIIGLPIVIMHRCADYFIRLVHHVNIDAYKIGPGFYIGHVGNIFIGPTNIGRNLSISHNVTIGIGHSEKKKGIPTIGDDVWIGTGAVLSGAIDIGNRATISAGSIVSRSIPESCLVAGNPARVLNRNYNNEVLFGMHENDSRTDDSSAEGDDIKK